MAQHHPQQTATSSAAARRTARRLVWRYGLGSAAVIFGLSALVVPLNLTDVIPKEMGRVAGYTTMLLAFAVVFFGIRAYRDEVGGGVLGFGKAVQIGLLMTLVTCAAYVACWQVLYWGFFPDFLDDYATAQLAALRDEGATAAEIAKARADMARFAELYQNPLFNIAVTFLEIFPVGLITTLVSAGILRRSTPAAQPGAALTV